MHVHVLLKGSHVDADAEVESIVDKVGCEVERHRAQHGAHPCLDRRVGTGNDVHTLFHSNGLVAILRGCRERVEGDVAHSQHLVASLEHKIVEAELVAVGTLGEADFGLLLGSVVVDHDGEQAVVVGGHGGHSAAQGCDKS